MAAPCRLLHGKVCLQQQDSRLLVRHAFRGFTPHAKSQPTHRQAAVAASAAVKRSASSTELAKPISNLKGVPSIKAQCAEHRMHVLQDILDPVLIIAEGKQEEARNSDVMHPFRQHSNFAYLTGVLQPGFACAINSETGHYTLLAPKLDPSLVVWMGAQPDLDELAEQYGADRCVYKENISQVISESGLSVAYMQHQLSQELQHAIDEVPVQSMAVFCRRHPQSRLLADILSACRAIKTEADVACLQHASAVSAQAHLAMWSGCQVGMHEYQLEAEFLRVAMGAGLRHTGYPSIVAAGRNAATLHYEQNNALVRDNDLVLVDAGAEFRCFTADISRTFPASGKFTAAQRDLYSAVLQVQEHAIALYQSGKGWQQEVVQPSRKLYCQLLLDLGIAKGSVDALFDNNIDKLFMPHALGHFLGMDVHDTSPCGPVPEQLQPGHVVTCEPGLYFVEHILESALQDTKQKAFLNEKAIDSFRPFGGIRIEDNIVVEAHGNKNLTTDAGMLKSVDEIEERCC